uniref:uncharacterized protein LOC120819820 isoform X2 n=1 Tax=Gasterosteus aculeatus aculeatus TaxID=481459 RepID=UPI001A996A84|nr:uncharacterized protein LOC120819820 isoform X2 [Gasterosteus aculeatus aculeatus]
MGVFWALLVSVLTVWFTKGSGLPVGGKNEMSGNGQQRTMRDLSPNDSSMKKALTLQHSLESVLLRKSKEDEIALSDAEDQDSGCESVDGCTAGRASEGETSEPVNPASDSTITKQVHDFEDAGSVSSTVNENYPLSEGKLSLMEKMLCPEEGQRAWSKVEVQAKTTFVKVTWPPRTNAVTASWWEDQSWNKKLCKMSHTSSGIGTSEKRRSQLKTYVFVICSTSFFPTARAVF